MALQLQIYVDLPPNSFRVHRSPHRRRKKIARTIRLGFGHESEGEKRSLSATRGPPTSGAAGFRSSFTEKGRSSITAAPGYSSRFRRQETNVQAGDRFMQVAEWVLKKVKDPMVEIDPVTVEKKIQAEEEEKREIDMNKIQAEEEEKQEVIVDQEGSETNETSKDYTVATIAPPATIPPISGFSLDSLSTRAAGIALLLAAVFLAYLGFRSKSALLSKSKRLLDQLSASPAPAGIGSKKDTVTSREIHHGFSGRESSATQDLRDQFQCDEVVEAGGKPVTLRASDVLTSSQSQLPFSLGVTPRKPNSEKILEQKAAASPAADPEVPSLEDVVALQEVGNDGSSTAADIAEQIATVAGLEENTSEVASVEAETKPLEEVVALKVDESSTEGVEIQNALIFDLTEEAVKSWPEELSQQAEQSLSASSNAAELGSDLVDTSGRQLPDLDLESNKSPDEPGKGDGPVEGILTGAVVATSELKTKEEERQSNVQAMQAAFPAIAVGAGAVSTLIGVTSGLQMVGLVASASFVARELIMASSRQQLYGDLRKINDHKSLMEFLKSHTSTVVCYYDMIVRNNSFEFLQVYLLHLNHVACEYQLIGSISGINSLSTQQQRLELWNESYFRVNRLVPRQVLGWSGLIPREESYWHLQLTTFENRLFMLHLEEPFEGVLFPREFSNALPEIGKLDAKAVVGFLNQAGDTDHPAVFKPVGAFGEGETWFAVFDSRPGETCQRKLDVLKFSHSPCTPSRAVLQERTARDEFDIEFDSLLPEYSFAQLPFHPKRR
ncbi:hypothetical protein R1flu_025823 [Riccia fluitans]|uniref:Uncharacterized protein n=1 Tax=Riccia fluitans TaxID=41844 RepID=A0ABD1Y1T7_9MARC